MVPFICAKIVLNRDNAARWPLVTLLLAATLAAHADDTELYLTSAARQPDPAPANLLFIVDTSDSMNSGLASQVQWHADTAYAGCYRTDALYFTAGTEPPPCDSAALITKSVNRCAASQGGLRQRGQFSDRMLGWNATGARWEALAATALHLECQSDRGQDGGGSAAPFAANGPQGPWSTDDRNEPGWNTHYTVFDGNWLNWRSQPATVMRPRLEVVREALSGLVTDMANINAGLMSLNGEEGGAVIHAVADTSASRDSLQQAIAGLTLTGYAPLSEAFYEAAVYLRGGDVDFGNRGPLRSVAAARLDADPDGDTYRSPLSTPCQPSFIILLADGAASHDESAGARISRLPGFAALPGACDGSGEGACLDDLAEYLYRTDALPALAGLQNVATYTIALGADLPLLEAAARRGGGRYFRADDSAGLASALAAIVSSIEASAGAIDAPTSVVGALSRPTPAGEVFAALFEPARTAHWPGNLKNYRYDNGQLLDRFDRSILDPMSGTLTPTTTSLWSGQPDGERVATGGAASRLPTPAARRLFTDLAGAELAGSGNRIAIENTSLTAARLGVDNAERERLIRWILGEDVADTDGDGDRNEPHRQVGDPLHVQPVTLDYGAGTGQARTVVFFGTNDGLLHAVDAESGAERWAYLPARLLDAQHDLLANPLSSARRYGLDGEIQLLAQDRDGTPGISGTDQARLLFGMGRGGRALFAVDVGDADRPVLAWQLDATSPGMASLGQVWAAPPVASLRLGDEDAPRQVVILSGGYDDAQDNAGYRTDTVGNALFILDLATGERLWSAGAPDQGHDLPLADMTNSIPAAPRVLDLTGDGLADRLYAADTGGRIWRFDIRNGASPHDLVQGGVLASLGGAAERDAPVTAARRFYATPDTALVECGNKTLLTLNIGSGFRGHPLDTTIEEYFFSVRDHHAFSPWGSDTDSAPITLSDLQDITAAPDAQLPADGAGWRLRLAAQPGEKVLSPATTLHGTIYFTSFAPALRAGSCGGGPGSNRSYQVQACHGGPVRNLDGSTESATLTATDRFSTLAQGGIAPGSAFIIPADGSAGPTRCIGLECFPPDDSAGGVLRRTYWYPQALR